MGTIESRWVYTTQKMVWKGINTNRKILILDTDKLLPGFETLDEIHLIICKPIGLAADGAGGKFLWQMWI